MTTKINNRYDFMILFDVKDGNPNGDPDAGNLPRTDAQTGEGIVTDVCIKRKIRNYVQVSRAGQDGYDVFVRSKDISGVETVLNNEVEKVYKELGIDLESKDDADGKKRTKGKAQGSEVDKGRNAMCNKFFDIRTFGAVMSTGVNAGQVRGPVQLTFARSVDKVDVNEYALTVCAARENEKKSYEERVGIQGRKSAVNYGLYVMKGFVTPSYASKTGFGEEDLALLWEAILNMFETDHSAARGDMSVRKLIVFKHDSSLGNAPHSALFDLVNITKKDGVQNPVKFSDYEVTIGECPTGVTLLTESDLA